MTKVALTIRYTGAPQRPTTAWLLPGGNPADWLRALTSADVHQQDVRLIVLPGGPRDRAPQGALATSTRPAEFHIAGAAPYGIAGERLYLPVEARLHPSVTRPELAEMLSADSHYVWTPRAGLVACEEETILSLADLVAAPPRAADNWGDAQPGVILAPRLLSLEPDHPPTLQTFLEQSRDDIGTQPEKLEDLPPSEDEPRPGALNAAARWGKTTLARTVRWFTQHAPEGTSDSPTWIDKLEGWANRALAAANASTQANRHKELHRLAELLDSNPDEGLKYALPMSSEAHRGIAPPSDRLAPP